MHSDENDGDRGEPQEQWQVLFEGNAPSANAIAALLERSQIPCYVDVGRSFAYGIHGTENAALLVGEKDFARARAIHDTWLQGAPQRVSAAADQFRVAALRALVPPAFWIASAWLVPDWSMPSIGALFGLYLGSLVVASRLGRDTETVLPPNA